MPKAKEWLARVGLAKRTTHYPKQLSGGEQQRVAIARAFAGEPKLLMADEPTGNLDNATGVEVVDLMFRLNREHGTTLLLVTHDVGLAARCARRLSLCRGTPRRRRTRCPSPSMSTLRLALRMLSRDWRAGELTVLIAAMMLAVASIGTVGFFADRVKGALAQQANLLLGADVLISGDRPLPDSFAAEAPKRGLAATPALKFNSMVQRAGADAGAGGAVLADVKAVGAGYPLRGAILLVDAANALGTRAHGIPKRGEAWPDARLAARLDAKVGDALAVGDSTLKVAAIVQQEPEVASGMLAIAPRLLINIDDVPATNLLQPGNRATYRLLVADLSRRAARSIRTSIGCRRELKAGQRMENVRDLRPEVRQTLERAEQFLGLSALVAVILAAVAVALAASRYLRRHLDTAAMLRCFGASRRRALALFVLQFGVLGLVASAAGVRGRARRAAAAGDAAVVDHRHRVAGAGNRAGDHGVRHRRAAALRFRAAAARRALRRSAAARAAPRPAATATGRACSPICSARA